MNKPGETKPTYLFPNEMESLMLTLMKPWGFTMSNSIIYVHRSNVLHVRETLRKRNITGWKVKQKA